MKREKENLIHDLLDEDSSHETILRESSRVLRRRRQWRAARQVVAVLALIAVTTVFYLRRETSHPLESRVSQTAPKPVSGPQIHALSDDELLALFTNTPVGLVSLADGKKKLIFPRPGDEQRFITKL